MAAKRMHLSLDSIRELLSAWQDEACRTVKARLRPMVGARLAEAEQSISNLHELAEGLRLGLSRLDDLPDRSASCDPSCAFLDLRPAASAPAYTAVREGAADAEPIACSLTGVDHAEQISRWHTLLEQATITHIPLGVEASLPVGAAGHLVPLVVAEQACCPFLGFAVSFHPQSVEVTVTVTDDAALPFVAALLPGRNR